MLHEQPGLIMAGSIAASLLVWAIVIQWLLG
jgi:hypothetical protein